ncbi:MAG: lysophospholipase [Methylococcales bacterium]|nr:alpha/beta hydrolase [Methylococcaceae bacterium]
MRKLFLPLLLLILVGCTPKFYGVGAPVNQAQLGSNTFLTEDGAHLPLRHWQSKTPPRAIIVALHGFNDYSRFFDQAGQFFSNQGVACFAYDQRGFGAAPKRGQWAGSDAYINDLKAFVRLLKDRHPELPIYLVGESMGGAVILSSLAQSPMLEISGVILAAPALWARSTMPWYQTALLWTLAHTAPWLTLTGESVKILPSDNIPMLQAMYKDPWVIKGTRVEAIYGLSDLMDQAFASSSFLHGKVLMLYGEKDQVIPKQPTYAFLQQLFQSGSDNTVAFYPQGYHMLLRDLQAQTVWQDIKVWIDTRQHHLPSGAEQRAKQVLTEAVSGVSVK